MEGQLRRKRRHCFCVLKRWSNGRVNLLCRMSISYSLNLLTASCASYSGLPYSFPNSTLGSSTFIQPNQIRQIPYPTVFSNSNSTTSALGNTRPPRIRNRRSLYHSPTHAQVQAILFARFPHSSPSDIALATDECNEVFENSNSLPRVSLPSQSLLVSPNRETMYDGFLRRKFQISPLC
jgi:hypothetical protein